MSEEQPAAAPDTSKSDPNAQACVGCFLIVILGMLGFYAWNSLTGPAPEAVTTARITTPPAPALNAQEQAVANKHGAPPVPSAWDGLAPEIAEWFRLNLKDPDSCEVVTATGIAGDLEKGWLQLVTYRAKNSFGAFEIETRGFVISHGRVVAVTED
jgi:hypothetical protein